jgi:hypothetical protein
VACPVISNIASLQNLGYLLFQAKNMSAVEIHHKLCLVYCKNIMSERTERQWCRMFKDGRTNVHNKE